MNWDRVEGNWKQLKGKAREKWGKLTDNDFEAIAGKKDQLIGRIPGALRNQPGRSAKTGRRVGEGASNRRSGNPGTHFRQVVTNT